MSGENGLNGRQTRRGWWRFVLGGLALLFVALAVVTWTSTAGLAAFGSVPDGARLERMRASPLFRDGTFHNPMRAPVAKKPSRSAWSSTREWLFGGEQRIPPAPLPLARDVAKALVRPPESGLRVTWMGHSTMLVELDGMRILTDPIWSDRASPSTVVGPRRFQPPPLALEELPHLDAVVLSHDHYDHLDMSTIQALASRGVTFYAPLGVGAHLEGWGVKPERLVELEWWQEVPLGNSGVRLVATPSQHFSGRTLSDRNRTLWTSWSLIGPSHRVFFSGDTGLSPEFPEIGRRFGPFDLTMIEVGAWHPSWGTIHLGPVHALEAHAQVNGRRMMPVHWGTFSLAMHAWDEPAETLAREARERQVELVMPMLGQPVEPTRGAGLSPWWRDVHEP